MRGAPGVREVWTFDREWGLMVGKHRKRPGLFMRIPEQRASRAVRVVDARTRLEHVVPGDALEPYRFRYLAKCGIEIVAASLVEPGRGRCSQCAR